LRAHRAGTSVTARIDPAEIAWFFAGVKTLPRHGHARGFLIFQIFVSMKSSETLLIALRAAAIDPGARIEIPSLLICRAVVQP
jgi:hypothetical protein